MYFGNILVELTLAIALMPLGSICKPLNPTPECSPQTFGYPLQQLPGTSPISISAAALANYTTYSESPGTVNLELYTVSFCNVTVTYTHPGEQDIIHVTVQLPPNWNGKLQALGGAGYAASGGTIFSMPAVAAGYATVDTDSGHAKGASAVFDLSWALDNSGQVNLHLLEDWGSTTLHEMAVIGKAAVNSFYGTKPKYSYFNGCSGGGRQGLQIAEKYPHDFDGILASSPAINPQKVIFGIYHATQVMNDLRIYPPTCEFAAFTKAAIAACDELDGVKDGIISFPDLCRFDAQTVVGRDFDCNGTTLQFTAAGADIVNAAWTGPRGNESTIGWFGFNKDADLSAVVSTVCSSVTTCGPSFSGSSITLVAAWYTYLIAKNPNFDLNSMTEARYFQSWQETLVYSDLVSAANPDLSQFRAAGGKLIIWQGLADAAIPPNGTVAFYQQVLARNPDAHSFALYFEAPGVGHCGGGPGALPSDPLAQLVSWVENGTAPQRLTAADPSGNTRNLCPYPLQQTYIGGNTADVTSYTCTPNPVANESIAHEFPFFDY